MSAHARLATASLLLALAAPHVAMAGDADCTKRVAALKKTLAPLTIGEHLTFTTAMFGPAAPVVEKAEVVTRPGLVLEVKGAEVAIEGVHLDAKLGPGLTEAVSKQLTLLQSAEEQAPAEEGAQPLPAYAWLDRGVKVADALGALCVLADRRTTRLVVEARSAKAVERPKVTPPQWVADELKLANELPNARPSILSRSLNRAIGTCEPLIDRLSKLPATPAEQGRGFKAALTEGLAACKCEGAEVDALEALVVLAIADGPTRWSLPLPLRCAAKDAAELTLPRDATMTKLAEALAKLPAKDRERPLRVVLR